MTLSLGLWSAAPADGAKAVALWEDGAVIYDESNGSLAALHAAAASVYQSLRDEGPATAATLAERLLGDLDDTSACEELQGLLMQLLDLGLVQRAVH